MKTKSQLFFFLCFLPKHVTAPGKTFTGLTSGQFSLVSVSLVISTSPTFVLFSIFVPGEIVALFLTGQGEGAIVLKIHKNRAFVGSGVNFVYLGPLKSQILFSGVVNCKLTPSS